MNIGKPISFLVKGNLKTNGAISLKVPQKELRTNLWRIRIQDIVYHCKSRVDEICSISTNIITDIYIENNIEVFYNPSIALLLLTGNINEKKCERFSDNWFYINNFTETLEFYFK